MSGRQRGSVAVAAIVALAVCLTVSVGMLLAGEGARASAHHEARTRTARAMAEAGVEYGYWQYAYRSATLPYSGARAFSSGNFSVIVTNNNAVIQRSIKIVSTGTVGADKSVVTRVLLDPFYGLQITGTVFEDVNYGGGSGRSLSASSGVRIPGARVELYDASGNFSRAATTDSNGLFTFSGVLSGTIGTVRVVSSSVRSSRTGSTATLLPIQTFRTDAASGSASSVTDHVGGETPALADAGNGASTLSALTTSTTTAQCVAPVKVGNVDLTQIDFGFSFDVVVNKNDAGPGSLRQFLLNAAALSNTGLAQAGRSASLDNAVFMLADGTARPGLTAAYASQFSSGIASISLASALPDLSDPVVLDGTSQPGWTSAPMIELNGAAVAAAGLNVTATACVIKGLIINRFGGIGLSLTSGGNGTVTSCFIGTNAAGTAASANSNQGIFCASSGNVIGGTATAARNVISGNGNSGVNISGSGNSVLGNRIGTNAAGTAAIANGGSGIRLSGASSNTIGGTAAGAGNLISGNAQRGIYLLSGTTGTTIQGNIIGGNAALTAALANTQEGVLIASCSGNTIGSTSLSVGANYIATNGGVGVSFTGTASGNVLQYSYVAYNSDVGVSVTSSGSSTGNALVSNSIYANGGLGIDIGTSGVTANNGTKSASLANNDMDFPVFSAATISGSNLTVSGYVGSASGQAVFAGATVQIFKSDNDSSGYGEGQTLVGTLTANSSGRFSGTLTIPGGVTLVSGNKITATATDGSSNTSEFSLNFACS